MTQQGPDHHEYPDKRDPLYEAKRFDEKKVIPKLEEFRDKLEHTMESQLTRDVRYLENFDVVFAGAKHNFIERPLEEIFDPVRKQIYKDKIGANAAVEWEELLKEVTGKAKEYKKQALLVIIDLAQESTDKDGSPVTGLDIADLNKMGSLAAALLERMDDGPLAAIYEKGMHGDDLEDTDYERLLRGVLTGKGKKGLEKASRLNTEDLLENLNQTGLWTAILSLQPGQKLELTKRILARAKAVPRTREDAKRFTETMLRSGGISEIQFQKLWPDMVDAGIYAGASHDTVMQRVALERQALKPVEDSQRENLEARQDGSVLNKDGVFGGLVLQIWRGANLFLNGVVAFKKRGFFGGLRDMASNPYMYVDVAAIAAGRQLAQQKGLTEFITAPSENDKKYLEKKRLEGELAEVISRAGSTHPMQTFYHKDADRAGAKTIAALRRKKLEEGAEIGSMQVTLEELIEIENNDPDLMADAGHNYRAQYLNDLQKDSNLQKKLDFLQLSNAILRVERVQEPIDLHHLYRKMYANQGLPETDADIKT